MKIFVSHSSKQKLFVREFATHRPGSVEYWIDEKAITAGDDFKDAIDRALSGECAFVALIVDDYAAKSAWVRYEIEKTIERERSEGRTILIPVVLSTEAWGEVEDLVGARRKYISCLEFTDDAIRSAARSFIETILDWLIAERSNGGGDKARSDLPQEFANAENTFRKLARELKTIIHPYRRMNPISLDTLRDQLKVTFSREFDSTDELGHAISELFAKDYMAGYFFDGEVAFLAAERFIHKADIADEVKQRIARRARNLLADDMSIAIDGGSTTLAFAHEIAALLEARAIVGLSVFTNSIPVAGVLLEALNSLNATERDASCQVHIMGGRCRHNSMCSLWELSEEPAFTELFDSAPDVLDYAFVGASGVTDQAGFGITHKYEVPAKKAFYRSASNVVVLSDSAKFSIAQPTLFAPFSGNMIIITDQSAEARIEEMRAAGSEIVNCGIFYVPAD